MSSLLTGTLLAAFGTLEGYAFFRSGMVSPAAVVDQMSFNSMIVMKLFVSAVGSSMIAQGILDLVAPEQFAKSRVMSKTSAGFPRAVGGSLLLGAGMFLCGAGPTIVPAQLFGGARSGVVVAIGALVGGALFALAEKALQLRTSCAVGPTEKATLDARLGTRYYTLALPAGAALLAAAAALEQAWPHSRDVARLGINLRNSWNPILAGAIIGFNQLPLRVLASRGQGGSTAIMNVLCTISGGSIASNYPLASVMSSAQFIYVWIGTSLGAFYALQEQKATFILPEGVVPLRAFVGGVAMMFGARLAQGCTCGHGISGMSELSVQSIAAGAAIFGGGIVAALVFNTLSSMA